MIEAGQKIYVTEVGFVNSHPNLTEYTVTRVNTVSFYAITEDSKFETRFDKRKMIGKSTFSDFIAYLTADEYWNAVKRSKEKKELMAQIGKRLNTLSLNTLRKFDEIIKENEKGKSKKN